MTFREPVEPVSELAREVSKTPLPVEEAAPEVLDETLEETPVIAEETFQPVPTKGEDPVRLYLKEIGCRPPSPTGAAPRARGQTTRSGSPRIGRPSRRSSPRCRSNPRSSTSS